MMTGNGKRGGGKKSNTSFSSSAAPTPAAGITRDGGGTGCCCLFLDLLNDDAIRAILIRTCASDHTNLRLTCRRFGKIMDTFQFRQERATLGYTELQRVRLLTPLQQYQLERREEEKQRKEEEEEEEEEEAQSVVSRNDRRFREEYDSLGKLGEYREHEFDEKHFEIVVDSRRVQMDDLMIHLLPRQQAFLEMCDDCSALDDANLSQCFNDYGKPRLLCLREALKTIPAGRHRMRKKPILFISRFVLPREFRSSAVIGPQILRALLLVEALKDEWSIAMYTPNDKPFRTQQDKALSKQADDALENLRQLHSDQRPESEIEKARALFRQKDKAWRIRQDELLIKDMRQQFFPAGFRQVSDLSVLPASIEDDCDDGNYYVYATASNIEKPVLSDQQALQKIEILKAPPLDPSRRHPGKTTDETKLFEKVQKKARHIQNHIKTIHDFQNKPVREIPMFRSLFVPTETAKKHLERELEQIYEEKQRLEDDRELHRESIREMTEEPQQQEQVLRRIYQSLEDDPRYSDLLRSRKILFKKERGSLLATPLTILDAIYRPCLQYLLRVMYETRSSFSPIEQLETQMVDQIRQEQLPQALALEQEKLRLYTMLAKLELQDLLDQIVNKNAAVPGTTRADILERLIVRSNVLHICAYEKVGQPLMEFFLEKLPAAKRSFAINYPNEVGATALMVAVGANIYLDSLGFCLDVCTYLIKQGADKNIITRDGCTALGAFRQQRRNRQDFNTVFFGSRSGRQQQNGADDLVEQIESLLLPTLGPNPADNAVLLEDEDDDDDDDESTEWDIDSDDD